MSKSSKCPTCGNFAFPRYREEDDSVVTRCGKGHTSAVMTSAEVSRRLEAFIEGDENDEVDTEALCAFFDELPECFKCQFVPATHVGALLGSDQRPIPGFSLCDKQTRDEGAVEFGYAESLRRAVRLLVDLDEEPWWLYYHQMKFKDPKTVVEVDGSRT